MKTLADKTIRLGYTHYSVVVPRTVVLLAILVPFLVAGWVTLGDLNGSPTKLSDSWVIPPSATSTPTPTATPSHTDPDSVAISLSGSTSRVSNTISRVGSSVGIEPLSEIPRPTPTQQSHAPAETKPTNDSDLFEETIKTFSYPYNQTPQFDTEQPLPKISLPDLMTLPPSDLRLVYNPSNGRKLVRFTNSVWNSGPGWFELHGRPNPEDDSIRVYQQLYASDDTPMEVLEIGVFIFHEQHDHWHLDNFALYEVRSLNIDTSFNTVVAGGNKLSYCLIDISRIDFDPPGEGYPQRRRYSTCLGDKQGLSPGWIDIYEHHLPGQWVDVTGLPDGIYALVTTANPDGIVKEADTQNNSGVTFFELEGTSIQVIEEPMWANPVHWPLGYDLVLMID